MNREHWLTEMAKRIEPIFIGFSLKPYRVTCGWPCQRGLARRGRVVGECHPAESSAEGLHEIFISPTLAKGLDVAGTLCHEMAHVVAGMAAQHGKEFVAVCRHVGLTKGRPTSVMPGDSLNGKLDKIIEDLGDYPHAALIPAKTKIERNPTVLGLTCGGCGCRVTISIKWLVEAGYPTCACGTEFALPFDLGEELRKLLGKGSSAIPNARAS